VGARTGVIDWANPSILAGFVGIRTLIKCPRCAVSL
jgi:hypothetical protein